MARSTAAVWFAWIACLGACTSGVLPDEAVTAGLTSEEADVPRVQADAAQGPDVAVDTDGDAHDAKGKPDAKTAADAKTDAAPADAGPAKAAALLPQVSHFGGDLLLAPHVVTVTFPGDPLAAQLSSFAGDLMTSAWWTAVSQGYCLPGGGCIGPGTSGGAVVLPFPPSPSYTDSFFDSDGDATVRQLLQDAIAAAQLPAPVTDTLYVVYFPPGVEIDVMYGDKPWTSCQEFGGYHESMQVAGHEVAYAVIPECDPSPGESTLEQTTIAVSHELIEAATDPYVNLTGPGVTNSGFVLDPVQPQASGWCLALHGNEVADLCPAVPWDPNSIAEFQGFVVSRSWSNQAAAAGHDPCQPAPPDQPYYLVAPDEGLTVLAIEVGKSVTIHLHATADGPMPDGWGVRGIDLFALYGLDAMVEMTFGGDESTVVHAGETVDAIVTLLDDPAAVSSLGALCLVKSGDSSNPFSHFWPILVVAK
jgi:hypothetical protein